MNYKPQFVAYLIYFNRDRDYFECHEVLEELWLEQNKDPLYKGLLQVAVGLYHFRNGNVTGGVKMLRSAAERLAAYPPDILGINLGKLRDEVEVYTRALEAYHDQPFDYYDLTIEIVDAELLRSLERTSLDIVPNVPQRRGPERGAKHELRQQNKRNN
ncbi:DUF309 domain-containing protein [Paenibacillus segetis]|uniref:DUF309 domain-containing protein n=1 Tax=Paenibacillus segetis TaxID=1325360 RepID=A0ABQ1Y900_9BACL|nr:DUF309 domain-containing protein [Paenibacillus segetis]GGH15977.1 hypothetical protein GCM10008013_10510 [Paenibacillus segetis]